MSHWRIAQRINESAGRDSSSGAMGIRHSLSHLRRCIAHAEQQNGVVRIQYRCGINRCLTANVVTVKSFSKDILRTTCGLEIKLKDIEKVEEVTK